jgi:hypothetical protein
MLCMSIDPTVLLLLCVEIVQDTKGSAAYRYFFNLC